MAGLDNDHMAEFNTDDFQGAFEFLLLSGFSDGPQSVPGIRQRLKRAEWLLGLAATRKGKQGLDSLPATLARLQREGWLQFAYPGEQPGPEIIYSLTDAGEQRLEQARAHRNWIVSQFVEQGELDGSFRRFLDRQGPLWSC